jgi:hypothetical protein
MRLYSVSRAACLAEFRLRNLQCFGAFSSKAEISSILQRLRGPSVLLHSQEPGFASAASASFSDSSAVASSISNSSRMSGSGAHNNWRQSGRPGQRVADWGSRISGYPRYGDHGQRGSSSEHSSHLNSPLYPRQLRHNNFWRERGRPWHGANSWDTYTSPRAPSSGEVLGRDRDHSDSGALGAQERPEA